MKRSTWDKIRDTLSGVAPALATAVGGPAAGMLTAAALKKVSEVAGVPGAPADKVLSALQSGAVDLTKLREADAKFAQEFKVELERIENEDRDSARRMRVDLGGDWTSAILAYSMTAMLAAAIAGLYLVPNISEQVETLLNVAIGGLLVGHKDIIGFYFGSSRGEHSKGA